VEAATIGKMFLASVNSFGKRTALRVKQGGTWQDISWIQFARNVRNLALGLIELGLESKERFAILSENRPEWAYADLAALSADAIDVPIYATNTPDQVKHILKDSASKFVCVSDSSQLDKVLQVRHELPALERIIIFDPAGQSSDKMILTLEEVLSAGRGSGRPEAFKERLDRTDPDEVASKIYTSGTTGPPKGVMLTHDNFLSNCRASLDVAPIASDDVVLSFLPLSHAFERMSGYYMILMVGGTIAFAQQIEKIPQNMVEVRPTVMFAVPRLFEKLRTQILERVEHEGAIGRQLFRWAINMGHDVSRLNLEKRPLSGTQKLKYSLGQKLVFNELHEKMGSRLRFFVSGGAPLAQEVAQFFHAVGITILEGYGLTETSPVISFNTLDNLRFGSVGQPVPGVDVKIATDGEILVRGPGVMKGYHGQPEATAEVIDADGWLYTGDIGYLDEDNFLHITDRKKDIIVTAGGESIAPRNIESMLKLNKYIEKICILGDKRKYLSALIVPNFEALEKFARERGIWFKDRADLVAKPEIEDLIQSVVERINASLAPFETIKQFRTIPHEFSQKTGELTPTMKVKRRVIDQKYKELIDSMYPEE